MAVAGIKTTAETAMAGDTVNNQLKGVAEEVIAAAMVTVAETATATKMVTIEAAGWVNGKTEPKKYSTVSQPRVGWCARSMCAPMAVLISI
jgi:hypothetical protein